jgi:hypothetical protein
VTGVGLDWPGYGDFLQDYETTVEAGRTLDLRVDLPEPRDATPSWPGPSPSSGPRRPDRSC